jgi:hypothetical protein
MRTANGSVTNLSQAAAECCDSSERRLCARGTPCYQQQTTTNCAPAGPSHCGSASVNTSVRLRRPARSEVVHCESRGEGRPSMKALAPLRPALLVRFRREARAPVLPAPHVRTVPVPVRPLALRHRRLTRYALERVTARTPAAAQRRRRSHLRPDTPPPPTRSR